MAILTQNLCPLDLTGWCISGNAKHLPLKTLPGLASFLCEQATSCTFDSTMIFDHQPQVPSSDLQDPVRPRSNVGRQGSHSVHLYASLQIRGPQIIQNHHFTGNMYENENIEDSPANFGGPDINISKHMRRTRPS